jgi:hypothetical protein
VERNSKLCEDAPEHESNCALLLFVIVPFRTDTHFDCCQLDLIWATTGPLDRLRMANEVPKTDGSAAGPTAFVPSGEHAVASARTTAEQDSARLADESRPARSRIDASLRVQTAARLA